MEIYENIKIQKINAFTSGESILLSIRFAIYGSSSHHISKPLKDFMYKSNKGNHIFFVNTED